MIQQGDAVTHPDHPGTLYVESDEPDHYGRVTVLRDLDAGEVERLLVGIDELHETYPPQLVLLLRDVGQVNVTFVFPTLDDVVRFLSTCSPDQFANIAGVVEIDEHGTASKVYNVGAADGGDGSDPANPIVVRPR